MHIKQSTIYYALGFALIIIIAFLLSIKYFPSKAPATDPVDRFACVFDSDCTNSCHYGAVNKPWAENHPDLCNDGCASSSMGYPKCINNSCVAYNYKNEVDLGCTRLDVGDVP